MIEICVDYLEVDLVLQQPYKSEALLVGLSLVCGWYMGNRSDEWQYWMYVSFGTRCMAELAKAN